MEKHNTKFKTLLPYKIVMNYLNPFVHGTLLIKEKIIKELEVMMKDFIMLKTINYLRTY